MLSPMLFNICMMKPQGFGTECHQHTNDSQFYFFNPLDFKVAVEVLESCLEAVSSWMRVNKLKLNPEIKSIQDGSHPVLVIQKTSVYLFRTGTGTGSYFRCSSGFTVASESADGSYGLGTFCSTAGCASCGPT